METGCFLSAFSKRAPWADPVRQGPRRPHLGPSAASAPECAALGETRKGRAEAEGPCHGSAPRPNPGTLSLDLPLPSYGKEPTVLRTPGIKSPRVWVFGRPAEPSHSRYSHAGLEAEQGAGARWHGGQQQHQGQGHRSSRGPRLRKDRHLAGGPAPGPSSGPQLTRGRGEPSEPPTPRAPWPGWGPGEHRAQPQVPVPDPPSPRSLQVQRVRLPARALGAAET